MTTVMLVAVGGALGASVRYILSAWWQAHFPWAILVANLVGSFVLGCLLVGAGSHMLAFVGVGFCGALTTFSTFALDTWVLRREGRSVAAGANVALSLVGSLAALALGLLLTRSVIS